MAKAKELRVGDPLDELTFCGAVNSKTHYEKVMSYIKLAVNDGATVYSGVTPSSSKVCLSSETVRIQTCSRDTSWRRQSSPA